MSVRWLFSIDTWSDLADTQGRRDCPMAAEFVDSVHLPHVPGEDEDEKIVRPSLAILFRMAVGDVAPECLGELPEQQMDVLGLDLRAMRGAGLTRPAARTGRSRLEPEIASLKRQMVKLFPESPALRVKAKRPCRVTDSSRDP